MNLGVAFAPLVPAYAVWAAFAVAVLVSVLLLLARSRGAVIRAIALALMVLPLANPSFTREDRDPIPSVAAVIVDKSPSQDFGDRNAQTRPLAMPSSPRSSAFPAWKCASPRPDRPTARTTAPGCFPRCRRRSPTCRPTGLPARFMITDGRVHDVPAEAAALGFTAPLHALITGHKDEIDRRVVLTATPRFGIVGQSQTIGFRVEDHGANAGTAAGHHPSRRRRTRQAHR